MSYLFGYFVRINLGLLHDDTTSTDEHRSVVESYFDFVRLICARKIDWLLEVHLDCHRVIFNRGDVVSEVEFIGVLIGRARNNLKFDRLCQLIVKCTRD